MESHLSTLVTDDAYQVRLRCRDVLDDKNVKDKITSPEVYLGLPLSLSHRHRHRHRFPDNQASLTQFQLPQKLFIHVGSLSIIQSSQYHRPSSSAGIDTVVRVGKGVVGTPNKQTISQKQGRTYALIGPWTEPLNESVVTVWLISW